MAGERDPGPCCAANWPFSWGRGGGPLLALGFFAAATTIPPLSAGSIAGAPFSLRLRRGCGSLSLASSLSLGFRFAERDQQGGALDLLALGPPPLALVAAIKCLAQWLATGLPLSRRSSGRQVVSLGAPVLATLMIAAAAFVRSLASLSPAESGAASALASRRGGILIALIVLPIFARQ